MKELSFHRAFRLRKEAEKDGEKESKNVFGEKEKYHAYLRSIFEKGQRARPPIEDEVVLQLATKAFNDIHGSAGLVLTLLVFFIIPKLPLCLREFAGQKKLEAL